MNTMFKRTLFIQVARCPIYYNSMKGKFFNTESGFKSTKRNAGG